MAANMQSSFWYYRGMLEGSDSTGSKLLVLFLTLSTLTGAIFICNLVYSFIRLIFSLFFLPGKSLRSFGAPSKTWAVITGASDGIGREFAMQLARAGYSTVLISRSADKLGAVAADIKSKFNTPVRTYAIDVGAASPTDFAELSAFLEPLDVGILINNVGRSHAIPVPFTQTPATEVDDIIRINCLGTLHVTQPIAQSMVARYRTRGTHGLILTMGSFGGTYPTPLLATYSGSKAFLQQWSSALGAELAPQGVTVELVQSYLVTSAMSKVRRPSLMVPTPRAFVARTLSHLGRTGGAQAFTHTATPYWSHAFMQWAIRTLLGSEGGALMLKFNKRAHEDIRTRALRKQDRDAKKAANGGTPSKKKD